MGLKRLKHGNGNDKNDSSKFCSFFSSIARVKASANPNLLFVVCNSISKGVLQFGDNVIEKTVRYYHKKQTKGTGNNRANSLLGRIILYMNDYIWFWRV
ncbi:MAG: hypothetical protein CW691_11925 [Candidatus Bathyarchaeum sp.]|nr:MAG: hypothetical protein CW691_11925 [Candidatus Bathyarchaeum sp.]